MDLMNIRVYPDSVLRIACAPLKKVTEFDADIFEQMVLVMRHYGGIGLAAPQVGILKRMIVASIGGTTIKLANPVIMKTLGFDRMREGCLSLPKQEVEVERPFGIVVEGLNEKGEEIELNVKGFLARVIQHEVDHLNGRLIIDYLTSQDETKEKDKDESAYSF